MSSAQLYRLSGIAVLVGSVISIVGTILGVFIPGPHGSSGTPAPSVALIGLIGAILIVLGLPALYVRQADRTRWLGLIGFVVLFVYALLLGIGANTNATVFLSLVSPSAFAGAEPGSILLFFLVSTLLGVIGGVLFGIATMRAHVFPRWAALLLIISSVISLGSALPLPDVVSAIVNKRMLKS